MSDNSASERYQIVGDESGHEYYVPVSRVKAWYLWLEATEDDCDGDVPRYATRIYGRFTFTDPKCELGNPRRRNELHNSRSTPRWV